MNAPLELDILYWTENSQLRIQFAKSGQTEAGKEWLCTITNEQSQRLIATYEQEGPISALNLLRSWLTPEQMKKLNKVPKSST
jgi:hypothetical protein